MSANLAVRISLEEGVRRNYQVCLCVVQVIPHGGNAHGDVSCLVSQPTMPSDLRCQGDIPFLLNSPIYGWGVELLSIKQEVLMMVIGGMRGFFRPGMERARVDWTVMSVGHDELWARGHEVNADERHDV